MVNSIDSYESNNLTEDTLAKLVGLVRVGKNDANIRNTVEMVLANIPEKNWQAEIEAIFKFVKDNVRYTRDIEGVEFVKNPVLMLKDIQRGMYGSAQGDCDCMSTFLATLLESAGYRAKFVIVRTSGNPYKTYNHIYVKAFDPKTSRWIPLDATMKEKPFGWEPESLAKKEYII